MPVNRGKTIRGRKTDYSSRYVVAQYKKAKSDMKTTKTIFDTGLSMIDETSNPIDCKHRETYINRSPIRGDTLIHRCHHGEKPRTPFERCRDCNIERCPL